MGQPDFPNFYTNLKEEVNLALKAALPEESRENKIAKAMRYSTLNGGKRFRGILVLEASNFGPDKNFQLARKLSAGVELVHAYSLVHDDLPLMDDDDYRRGVEACHVRFDDHTAILCGNSLLSLAYEIYSGLDFPSPADNVMSPVELLAKITGHQGVPFGQQLDMDFENREPSASEILSMYRRKTGYLIGFAMKVGALAGGLKPQLANELKSIGENIGIAYQIVDDLREVDLNFSKLGKDQQSDLKNKKQTLVHRTGTREARKTAKNLLNQSIDELDSTNLTTYRISEMLKVILTRFTDNS